jgi:hypothetical protein
MSAVVHLQLARAALLYLAFKIVVVLLGERAGDASMK